MPTITVEMLTGRTEVEKAALIDGLRAATVRALRVDDSRVRVRIVESEAGPASRKTSR